MADGLGLGVVHIGHVLEEQQPEHRILVFRRRDGAAQLVGGLPQGALEFFVGHGVTGSVAIAS